MGSAAETAHSNEVVAMSAIRKRKSQVAFLAWVAAMVGVVGVVLWAASRMDYRWQWYRVPSYLLVQDGDDFYAGILIDGLGVTLKISILALLLAMCVGFVVALLGRAESIVARALARTYIEILRNTPILVQLFLIYYMVAPIFGLNRFLAGVVALGLYEGSFAAEIYRAGIEAVPRSQWEAGKAIGLSRTLLYYHIIIPQAIRVILPAMTNLGINLIKHSAIVSVIAISDLTTEGRNIIADTFLSFEIWFTVAAIYLVITTGLSGVASLLERRFARYKAK